jgi:hypothetical protein
MVIIQNNKGTIFHYMQSISAFAPFIVIAPKGIASNKSKLVGMGGIEPLVRLTTTQQHNFGFQGVLKLEEV